MHGMGSGVSPFMSLVGSLIVLAVHPLTQSGSSIAVCLAVQTAQCETPLHLALRLNDITSLKFLLEAPNFDVAKCDSFNTKTVLPVEFTMLIINCSTVVLHYQGRIANAQEQAKYDLLANPELYVRSRCRLACQMISRTLRNSPSFIALAQLESDRESNQKQNQHM